MKTFELLKAVVIMWYNELRDCEEYSLFGKVFITILHTLMAFAILVLVLVLVILEAVVLVPIWFLINICHKKKFRVTYKEFFEEMFGGKSNGL